MVGPFVGVQPAGSWLDLDGLTVTKKEARQAVFSERIQHHFRADRGKSNTDSQTFLRHLTSFQTIYADVI
jgi:hypothetical protein